MSDARRPDESFEDYKIRCKAENIATKEKLRGTVDLECTYYNRTVRKAIEASIPKDDALVLSKICELMDDGTPLVAMHILYKSQDDYGKKEMIKNFKQIICESA